MTLGFMARAVRAGLAKLGEPATLGGVACGRVAIARNVQVFAGDAGRADDNSMAQGDVASIDTQYMPKVGQTLVHPDGTFKLSRKLDDNGYLKLFIVVGA